jgi:hypothetical protein
MFSSYISVHRNKNQWTVDWHETLKISVQIAYQQSRHQWNDLHLRDQGTNKFKFEHGPFCRRNLENISSWQIRTPISNTWRLRWWRLCYDEGRKFWKISNRHIWLHISEYKRSWDLNTWNSWWFLNPQYHWRRGTRKWWNPQSKIQKLSTRIQISRASRNIVVNDYNGEPWLKIKELHPQDSQKPQKSI